MRNNTHLVALLFALLVALIYISIYAVSMKNTAKEYSAREANRSIYNTHNYSVEGELYAVKPNGTEVVIDSTGRLWEVEGLKVGTHDRVMIEIHNDEVSRVWREVWKNSN